MKTLSPANNDYLLEVSVEDLHKDVALWLSETEFWRVELAFFQKLIEKAAVKTFDVEDKQKISHFQNLIIYYQGDVLKKFQKDVHEHEVYLKNLLDNKRFVNDQFYRETHHKLTNQLMAIGRSLKEYKRELFVFMEKFLST